MGEFVQPAMQSYAYLMQKQTPCVQWCFLRKSIQDCNLSLQTSQFFISNQFSLISIEVNNNTTTLIAPFIWKGEQNINKTKLQNFLSTAALDPNSKPIYWISRSIDFSGTDFKVSVHRIWVLGYCSGCVKLSAIFISTHQDLGVPVIVKVHHRRICMVMEWTY